MNDENNKNNSGYPDILELINLDRDPTVTELNCLHVYEPNPRMLDPNQICARLNIPKGTLLAWVSTGRVPLPPIYRYSDRTWRMREDDLEDWLERRRQERSTVPWASDQ